MVNRPVCKLFLLPIVAQGRETATIRDEGCNGKLNRLARQRLRLADVTHAVTRSRLLTRIDSPAKMEKRLVTNFVLHC